MEARGVTDTVVQYTERSLCCGNFLWVQNAASNRNEEVTHEALQCCDNNGSSKAKSYWFFMLQLRDLLLKTNPMYDWRCMHVDERNPEIELFSAVEKGGKKGRQKVVLPILVNLRCVSLGMRSQRVVREALFYCDSWPHHGLWSSGAL